MNLLAPDLLAEVFITIGRDGTSHCYFSKVTRDEVLQIASAIVNAGVELAQRYGFQLEFKPLPAAEGQQRDPVSGASRDER